MERLDRINQRPEIMGEKACIRGLRGTVGMIVGQIGSARSIGDLLAQHPFLEREDIMQAPRYAAAHACVVLTHDLDFSAVLAAAQGTEPCDAQIRSDNLSPAAIAEPLISASRQMSAELAAGALLTVDPVRTRLHMLPLRADKP
jgi:uncharacterized protein (DUF433 family)